MKNILTLLIILISFNLNSQNIFKDLYKDFLKYGTIYIAGDIDNPKEENKDYFVRTPEDGSLYSIPEVIDGTAYYDFEYRYGFGIRKIARFDYEIKGKQYYDGTESNVGLSATNSAVKGLEYVFHTEKERSRDEIYNNHRYFVKHSGKYHMLKVESRAQGKIDFKYKSAEARVKLPIGDKFSLSAGAIYRTHERPYGYNPISIWLNETNDAGQVVNPWYTLGFYYGYDDIYYTQQDQFGNQTSDWYWIDAEGTIVANTDLEFRDTVFADLMNQYNEEMWAELDNFGLISPVIGFDFYHYKNNFWLHTYGSYLLPYHKYVKGDEQYSYLHRDGWNMEGHNNMHAMSDGEQWDDYQAGVVFGWKISRSIGIFAEAEYTKFWDSKIYNGSVGLNITLK